MSCWQSFSNRLYVSRNYATPGGRVLEGFAQELCQAGYAEITARRHIRAAEHLIHWLGRRGRTVAVLDERTIEEFVHHLNRCRCPRYGRTHRRDIRKGARLFLRYARFADIVTTRIVQEVIVDRGCKPWTPILGPGKESFRCRGPRSIAFP